MNSFQPEILLITRPLTPPWDEASKNLAYSLAKEITDFNFHILVGKYDASLPKHITQHLIYKGPEWTTLQKTRLIFSLRKILKENPGINIAHLLFAPTPLNTRVLKSILKKSRVKVVQNLACPPKSKKNLLFGDKIVAYSHFTAQKIASRKTAIIPPFVEPEKFPVLSEKERTDLRKKWGLGENEKVLLYPGEYSRLNALGDLWRGYSELKVQIEKLKVDFKLIVACRIKSQEDLKKEKKFKKLINLSPHKNSVIFAGKVKNVSELYQISDLTVLPARSMEGKFDFPFVLIESLLCGTPILTSAVGALPEIWGGKKELEREFILKSEKPNEFAKKSLNILDKKRTVFKNSLSKYAESFFEKKKAIERYKELYRTLIVNDFLNK